MNSNFNDAVALVLKNEGGYVNNPSDQGGITNYGISLRFLQSVNMGATADTIKNLTIAQARDIYFKHFWEPNNYEGIYSKPLAIKIFDTCVNVGGSNANKFLQQALNIIHNTSLAEDGRIGKATLEAVNDLTDVKNLIEVYRLIQKQYYANIVIKNNTQLVFLKGWFKRASN